MASPNRTQITVENSIGSPYRGQITLFRGPIRPTRKKSAQSLDERGVGHAAALTHRLQTETAA
jgi:hypothetical protein